MVVHSKPFANGSVGCWGNVLVNAAYAKAIIPTWNLLVAETVGDCAYGEGQTRQAFADAQRTLVAKIHNVGRKDQIYKTEFQIDLEGMTCTCPAGYTTDHRIAMGFWPKHNGVKQPKQFFSFLAPTCAACPLRAQCVKTEAKRGRTIQLHPQEAILQQARALQNSPAFQAYRQVRQTVEHRQARLVQLGIRHARYVGRKKALFQLLMAATVANLTLIATKTGQMRAKTDLFSALFALRKALQGSLEAIAYPFQRWVPFILRSMAINMRVRVQRQADLRAPQPLLDDFGMNPGRQQEGRVGEAGKIKPPDTTAILDTLQSGANQLLMNGQTLQSTLTGIQQALANLQKGSPQQNPEGPMK